jgi:hypothetical protein
VAHFTEAVSECQMSLTYLFVDDLGLSQRQGLRRQVTPASKLADPVLRASTPWEVRQPGDHRLYLYGTVLADPERGGWRMWYSPFPGGLCLAHSSDGATWTRVPLPLVPEGDLRLTNQLAMPAPLHSPSMVLDPFAPPAERYKLLGCGKVGELRGYCTGYSADGLTWQLYPKNPALHSADTCTLAQDPKTGEFLAFHKRTHDHRGTKRRLVYLATSKDMQHWSEPTLALAPDELDDQQTQAEGGLHGEFYNLSAFAYGDQWLGLVTQFRKHRRLTESAPSQSKDDGPIEVQLIHSRDGRTWQRCEDRSPIIANGPYDYDRGCILGVANLPVLTTDAMWIFYTGINTTHGGALPEKECVIARAEWPRDRWLALVADAEGAITRALPASPTAARLTVNADARGGELRVAVLDAQGQPLPGFAAEDCQPCTGDHPAHALRWRGGAHLPTGTPFALRFHLRRARLYAMTLS